MLHKSGNVTDRHTDTAFYSIGYLQRDESSSHIKLIHEFRVSLEFLRVSLKYILNKPHSRAGSVKEETHKWCQNASDNSEAIDYNDNSIHCSLSL